MSPSKMGVAGTCGTRPEWTPLGSRLVHMPERTLIRHPTSALGQRQPLVALLTVPPGPLGGSSCKMADLLPKLQILLAKLHSFSLRSGP